MLQVLGELDLLRDSEGTGVVFEEFERRLGVVMRLTFKKGGGERPYCGGRPLLLDRFYVILIMFLKSSPVLLQELFLETDLILWSQFFLGKSLETRPGQFLRPIRGRVLPLLNLMKGVFVIVKVID